MKVDTWMPFFIGDYLKDTGRLSTLQHGAYCLLIFDYWINGAPPDDDEVLAAITKLPERDWRAKHRSAIASFFDIRDGHWHHGRVDRELIIAREKREAAENRARTAAEARYSKQRSADAPSSAPSSPEAPPGACPEQTPSPSPISPSLRSGERARGTRLPADWVLPDDLKAWALHEQPTWDKGYVQHVAANFRDYWIATPGNRGTKLDWAATWRTWVRKEGPRKGPAGVVTVSWRPGSEPDSVLREAARKLQIEPWQEGETHGQFRQRIVDAGGENLLKPPRRAA